MIYSHLRMNYRMEGNEFYINLMNFSSQNVSLCTLNILIRVPTRGSIVLYKFTDLDELSDKNIPCITMGKTKKMFL